MMRLVAVHQKRDRVANSAGHTALSDCGQNMDTLLHAWHQRINQLIGYQWRIWIKKFQSTDCSSSSTWKREKLLEFHIMYRYCTLKSQVTLETANLPSKVIFHHEMTGVRVSTCSDILPTLQIWLLRTAPVSQHEKNIWVERGFVVEIIRRKKNYISKNMVLIKTFS